MVHENISTFLSYAHEDDALGIVKKIWVRLEHACATQAGFKVEIFRDTHSLEVGDAWRRKMEEKIDSSQVLFPIITPTYFNRPECRKELERFRRMEERKGRTDLIFPIYLISTRDLSENSTDPLRKLIAERQYVDLRDVKAAKFATKKATEIFDGAGLGDKGDPSAATANA